MDGRARLDAGRRAVSAGGVAHRRPRRRARIPPTVRFQEKWRLALTLLRQVRAAGFHVTAVLGRRRIRRQRDAASRRCIALKLPYALGVSSTLTVFPGTPRPSPCRRGRAVGAERDAPGPTRSRTKRCARWPRATARAWRRVTWRNGTNPPVGGALRALRVTPAHDWRARRLAPEVWLLFERDLGTTPRTKAYLVALPATASLQHAGRVWPISAGRSSSSIKN